MKQIFSMGFRKNTDIHLTKIRPVGAELLHADGRTDMTTQTVASRNFANAPKNSLQRQPERTNVMLI
jgi:hypothetical protein